MDNEKNSLSRNIEKIINFANKTKKAGYKSFIEDLLSINVDITLNAVQETAIYMTKIKKNNNLLSIDELITPLEEAVRIYVNFRKSFPNLKTNQISYLKGNIGIKKLSNTLKNSIKKYAPSLLNEITSDEFIDAFDGLNDLAEVIYKHSSPVNKIVSQSYSISR